MNPKHKISFKKARSITPLHTSGPVAITSDGSKIVTCVGEQALLTEIATVACICRFAGDSQTITSLCLSPDSHYLLLFTASHALHIYEVPFTPVPLQKIIQPVRVVGRAHDAPVHVCEVDPSSNYLAAGSADGVVKVWSISQGYITHVFKGHGGVVSALVFNYPQNPSQVTQEQKMQLITASVDTRVRIFDLKATSASRKAGGSKPEAVLEGHSSVPRGLDVTQDGKWLISGGRDSVVLLWDLKSKSKRKGESPILVKTIPVIERVEAIGFLREREDLGDTDASLEELVFYTAGEKGVVKVWNAKKGRTLFVLGDEPSPGQEEQRQCVDAIYCPRTSVVVSIHADQNILFHSISSRTLSRQLIGFNDEIVDATFLSTLPEMAPPDGGDEETHIALATNSSLIRVYSLSDFDARLLSGHSGIVLCLDHSLNGKLFASGSKDKSARIWAPLRSKQGGHWGWGCVGICEGHAESLGAIALSRVSDGDAKSSFLFTGSQDRTIKMWDLSNVPTVFEEGQGAVKCGSLLTHKAHDKDINSLDISPNDMLLASGSQDRTAKIYNVVFVAGSGSKPARGELKLIGTCKGHKRGIWTVRFGRAERVLATGSGDKTIKLWNLEDFSCVKTFEGHTNSVLRVDFINLGVHLVSTASDGLVKLWSVRDEECVNTLDNHEDKVWAIAIKKDESTIVSGAADAVVTFWNDCTEEQESESENKRVDMVQKEQDFQNYLSLHDYRKAIQLALAMQQPGRLLSLFETVRTQRDTKDTTSLTGSASVDEVIRTLGGSDLPQLLKYVRDWNANAKTSVVAQSILYAVMKLRSAQDVIRVFQAETGAASFTTPFDNNDFEASRSSAGTPLKDLVDALIPYTERHLSRLDKLLQDSYMVDYILSEMDDGVFDGNDSENGMDVDNKPSN